MILSPGVKYPKNEITGSYGVNEAGEVESQASRVHRFKYHPQATSWGITPNNSFFFFPTTILSRKGIIIMTISQPIGLGRIQEK